MSTETPMCMKERERGGKEGIATGQERELRGELSLYLCKKRAQMRFHSGIYTSGSRMTCVSLCECMCMCQSTEKRVQGFHFSSWFNRLPHSTPVLRCWSSCNHFITYSRDAESIWGWDVLAGLSSSNFGVISLIDLIRDSPASGLFLS